MFKTDGYDLVQTPIRKAAMVAQARSQLKMDAFVHRQFVFDSGMSFYCKVCGEREQSMQPAEYFTHRKDCPLKAIVERAKAAGGWPDREGDDVDWDRKPEPEEKAVLVDGYPPDWPRCPGCMKPALDGHITCGDARCDEGARRP